jgi:hypothetical protein
MSKPPEDGGEAVKEGKRLLDRAEVEVPECFGYPQRGMRLVETPQCDAEVMPPVATGTPSPFA